MISLSAIIIALVSAESANATMMLQTRDTACGDGQNQVVTQYSNTCCPGVRKHGNGTTLCCYKGSDGGCRQTDCDDDLSSCQGTFVIDDPDYAENVKNATGVTINNPNSGPHNTPMLGMVAGLTAMVVAISVS
ncbi:hypothetical protein F4821DRAFT_275359 [Hypoxylon rubiginosum]|uniref:Uncharacterized protein n=1 Tax=Hypoxylon rubiginosum TaxID=110542 RepID=A0ACC0DC57_9PEZI|nr:hypothetical protein F4821DRAFT_275359 [Hypoxylon rubiginosum]